MPVSAMVKDNTTWQRGPPESDILFGIDIGMDIV